MSSPALALVGLLLICSVCVARIPPEQRRFVSPAIDAVIDDISSRLRDPDVAKLFVNAYPNTLDTTVWNFTDSTPYPDSFIITGDIHAQWLRDSTNQILPYLPYAKPSIDAKLHRLACGLINRQARDILHDPFANAFNYDETGGQHMDDKRYPPMTAHVFEGKYELDSLAAFLKLSFGVYNWTGDFSCVDPVKWKKAVSVVIQTITAMQASTEEDFDTPSYLFQRQTTVATDTLMMSGHGPVAARTGMSKSLFRPSDDAVTLPFLIPANAMAVVELCHTATMCRHSDSPVFDLEIASSATALAIEIEQALMKYGVALRSASQGGTMFAYEADGFGGQTFMDDANVPSLLSLPYLGFISRTDPIYSATRAFILSPRNPYYFAGSAGAGVGGPHVGMNMVWPMSLIMTALTSNSDDEIVQCLNTLKSTTAGTYFVHESFNKNNASIFTRSWFAWANALFGELVLTLARERPHLIF